MKNIDIFKMVNKAITVITEQQQGSGRKRSRAYRNLATQLLVFLLSPHFPHLALFVVAIMVV